MLSLRNISKIYNVKGKAAVHALDNITVDFPENGMVFLLGKSGSGKSTLLNVAGGLDVPTSGEIIVDGKSTANFTHADYDGYRNTYVGFVFQEYNILEKFSVEQNVSLALQLQSMPNDKKKVDDILEQVGLSGMNKRKPNTLSGGQRQRVAIARALIKNPKIIMADEPTGALDSKTGEQIFDTLKELSKTRLILVVSHDRDFAERYADRIIELADGKIISDNEITQRATQTLSNNYEILRDDAVLVRNWSKPTQADFAKISRIMSSKLKETLITSDPSLISPLKAEKNIRVNSEKSAAENTKNENASDGTKKNFVKSRLPLKHALKLAWGGIKQKPIRLAFTILLSVAAFTLFGISSALMLYDPAYSISNALSGSDYKSATLNKEYVASYTQTVVQDDGYAKREQSVNLSTAFTQADIDKLNDNDLNLNFAGIMNFGVYENANADSEGSYLGIRFTIGEGRLNTEYSYYYCVNALTGFSDCGANYLESNGFTLLTGKYPENKNEVAVPRYVYEYYAHTLISSSEGNQSIVSAEEILGRTISFGQIPLTICGVYDVGDISVEFDELLNPDSQLDYLTKKALSAKLADILENGFHTVAFVSDDFYAEHKYDYVSIGYSPTFGFNISETPQSFDVNESQHESVITPRALRLYGDIVNFYDLNGNKTSMPQTLAETDIYISMNRVISKLEPFYRFLLDSSDVSDTDLIELKTVLLKLDQHFSFYKLDKSDIITLAEKSLSAYEKFYGYKPDLSDTYYAKFYSGDEQIPLTVKGYFLIAKGNADYSSQDYFISDDLRDKYAIKTAPNAGSVNTVYKTDYRISTNEEKYGKLICPTDYSLNETHFILNGGKDGATYVLDNIIYEVTNEITSIVAQMKKLFYISGAIVGAFAVLMLFNFITASISAKAREIGILRSIGANKFDVIKIFFTETLLITLTCFVVSAILSGVACALINAYTIENALKITILDYNAINIAILLSTSLAVSILSTVAPTLKVANKPPVVGIRE